MKHIFKRAAFAIFLAFTFPLAHGLESAEPSLAPAPKYQLVYSAAVVQFDRSLSEARVVTNIPQVLASTLTPGGQGLSVDAAAKILAGGSAYTVKNDARIVTGDGVPGKAANTATHYVYRLDERLSADGQIKTTTAKAEPQRVGFDLTVSPSVNEGQAKNTVTSVARIEHGVEVGGTDRVSTVIAEGESPLGAGSIQVITWTNAGQAYALVLSLDSIRSVQ